MTKKPAQARTTRHTTPPITDPHLTALLLFLDGQGPSDVPPHGDIRALASRILADAPASLTGQLGHPSIFGSLTDRALRHYQKAGKDARSEATVLGQILSYGDHDITITDSTPAFSVLVRCVNDAATLGACLMYELLKGAR